MLEYLKQGSIPCNIRCISDSKYDSYCLKVTLLKNVADKLVVIVSIFLLQLSNCHVAETGHYRMRPDEKSCSTVGLV